jgi:Grx4 family monothiol glutaredoxin
MEAPSNFVAIKTEKEFNQLCLHNFDKLFIVTFFADWHEPSVHLTNVTKSLAKQYEGKCIFASVNADDQTLEALSTKFNVELVPTVIIMKSTKEVLHRIEEDSPAILSSKVEEYSNSFRTAFETEKTKMFAKIQEILNSFPLVIFIKGTPEAPKCGFSEQLLEQLRELRIKFQHFDILSDESVRNWLRYYATWITYPQVWVQGKLVGGLDVTKEKIKSGEFQELIKPLNLKDEPESVAQRIIGTTNVVAIIRGKVSSPANPESEELVKILQETGIRFSSFDLDTADEPLLAALKQKLGTEAFPCLVVEKSLLGDLNKIRELSQNKELTARIPKDDLVLSINEKLKELINSNPIMVFMKGVPEAPQCGFSRKMVDLLNKHGVGYGHFNIFSDNVVRERLKEYSEWKTYPQLYVDGEFVGGLDIALEMDASGELFPMIEKYVKI